MKFIILILLFNAIKCKGSCDNKTAHLFWKKIFSFFEEYPLDSFLNYHKTKRKLKSFLNSNHPNLQCDINEVCNTKLSYEVCLCFEENYKYDFNNGLINNYDLRLYDIDFAGDDIELDLESYLGYYSGSGFEERYSFCEMFFILEHKTKFVFLVDYFELWLFSHRNFTIHSNQLTKKSGNSFLTKR